MSSSARLGSRNARSVLAGVAAAASLLILPQAASADFTLARCGGSEVTGRGASFQTNAQTAWINLFSTSTGCSGTPTIGTYQGDGSGAGRRAFGERSGSNTAGARDAAVRYAAADEAPNPTQTAQINAGPVDGNGADVTAGDDGIVHTIPVAVGSTVVAVNYPEGCTLPTASATSANVPGTGDQTARLKISAADIEKVFSATTTTWGSLVPGIDERDGSRADGSCASQVIRRVVRFEDSGTTFSVKSWLNTVNGTTDWTGQTYGKSPNTTWPTTTGPNTPKPITSPAVCDVELCSGSGNGNGQLLTVLAATDGAFGYSDIRTARQNGFEMTPANSGTPDTTYWIPVQNKVNSTYYEPTSDANGYRLGGNPGANCASAVFATLPASTTGDWSKVVGANSPTGYPLCVITYMLAWDDYSKVYGSSDTEQAKARTVKDYLDMILGPVAQQSLVARDYQGLPDNLLGVAKSGAAQVSWNKGGGGGTVDPDPTPSPAPSATPTPGGTASPTPTPQPPAQVSNQFSIVSARVSKSSVITAVLRLPGAGVVSATATARSKGFRVGSATGTATGAGNLTVTIKPSSKTKKALKKLKKSQKLKVDLAIAFSPTGGTPNSATKSVSLKGTKKAKKSKKTRKK